MQEIWNLDTQEIIKFIGVYKILTLAKNPLKMKQFDRKVFAYNILLEKKIKLIIIHI